MKKVIAAATMFALSACGSGDPAPGPEVNTPVVQSSDTSELTAKYLDILNENYVVSGGVETSAEDVTALLPESIKLTIGSSSFDADSGATIWTNVSLTGAENTDVGITADEVKLWGLNTDGITARVAGENLDQTVKLAERIEASGVRTLGLDVLMSNWMVSYIEGISQTIETFAPDEGINEEELAEIREAMEMVVNEYSFEVERMVAVGPKLRPWVFEPIDIEAAAEAEDEGQAVLFVLQEAVAYYRAFGVDEMVWTDTTFDMVMDQDGVKQDVTGGYGLIGYSGWNGGDIERSLLTDMRMNQTVDMREAFEDFEAEIDDSAEFFQEMDMDFTIALATVDGMKLDKVLEFIALGEWPSTDVTDLMAYGRVEMDSMDVLLNGATFFAIDKTILDFSSWHWFIPNEAEVTLNGFKYDIEGFFNMMGPILEADDPEAWQMMQKGMEIAKNYEALPILYDQSYFWDWNPETGVFSFKSPQKHHTFGEADFEISGFLPNFEDGVAAFREDMAYEADPDADIYEELFRETAWEKLVEEKFSVTGGFLKLEDQGGLDKLFPLIIEIGKLNPDEAGPMIANSTPEALRQAAVSGIGFGAIQMGKEMPQAENWIMSFADWVRDGGTFTVRIDPSEPLGAHLQEKYPDLDPDQIAEILGITVTHETP